MKRTVSEDFSVSVCFNPSPNVKKIFFAQLFFEKFLSALFQPDKEKEKRKKKNHLQTIFP